ncbi:MAG: serine/threonine-protein kinase [Friedmanniella sp.]
MAEPHALLADRYRLVRQVGSGGMGVVWEAWDERLERPVAVKQLRAQVGLTPDEAELAKNRAMREARITARLHHRNAVPVFDVVEHEGQPCLIMQFLPSVPLSAVLREGGPLQVHEAAQVGAQVASALAAAHQLDIVHRDVKPGNILIADDGTALISDFGISHALGDATLTSTGLVHGTPAYLAPEVARGEDSGFASDVFSLGATLYAALEGTPPFGTDHNSIALLHKVASGDFAAPQRAGVLTPLLLEMLRPDPDDRPSMKEAAARLAAGQAATADAATVPMLVATSQPEPAPAAPTAAMTEGAAGPASGGTDQGLQPSVTVPRPVQTPPPAGSPAHQSSRRRIRLVVAVALLLGLALLGTTVVRAQLGKEDPGASGGAVTPGSTGSAGSSTGGAASPSAAPRSSSTPSATPSATRTSASPTRTPTPTPTPTSGQGGSSASNLAAAITDYYALVPDKTDGAWPRLTSRYQQSRAGGRQAYNRFWGGVDRVDVSGVRATPPGTVQATITYHYRDDRVVEERTSYRLVEQDGILKIDDSTVLSSSTQ